MTFRIFETGSGIAQEARDFLLERDCVLDRGRPQDSEGELEARLARFDPDALIVRQGSISRRVQMAAAHLKVICKHGVGTDNIDIAAATERGIPVLFTPGANSEAAAEHTLALMLALLRRVRAMDHSVRSGAFDKSSYDGLELSGKTVGIIGFGRIGQRLAELLEPFRVTLLVHSRWSGGDPSERRVRKAAGIEEVLRRADVISLHTPLTDETRGLLSRQAISMMKQGAYLINAARGGLVDEHALAAALASGRLGGAALDVFSDEPLPNGHPLTALDNVILSPHVAGASDRSGPKVGLAAAANVLAALNGDDLPSDVVKNPGALIAGRLATS